MITCQISITSNNVTQSHANTWRTLVQFIGLDFSIGVSNAIEEEFNSRRLHNGSLTDQLSKNKEDPYGWGLQTTSILIETTKDT